MKWLTRLADGAPSPPFALRGTLAAEEFGHVRYRLRTLLIVLALGPLVLWGVWACWQTKAEPRPVFTSEELIPILNEWEEEWNRTPANDSGAERRGGTI
ncbi:MAG TPA: hypothetical protein VFB96_19070 [Pirellulaceae bacterium]|nr:hypothetical protein [Pirellulaceae bacterium]